MQNTGSLLRGTPLVGFFLLALAAVLALSGCVGDSVVVQPDQRYLLSEQLAVPAPESVLGAFNARIIFMADQLERNLDRKELTNSVVVASFVNLDRLSETTPFGRLLAEGLIHELQVRKWQVVEMRLARDVAITEQGEFTLTRDAVMLKGQSGKAGGIVTGTYSAVGGGILVNARLIDVATGAVVSSAQTLMPLSLLTDLPAQKNEKPNAGQRAMKIIGELP